MSGMTFDVTRKQAVVVGGGRSGRAAAELLLARGARVTLADRQEIEGAARLEARGVSIDIGPHRPDVFAAADLVVLSPGVRPSEPAVAAARAAGIPVIGELELASRWLLGPVVAITGTKGKSTTTTLTARMFEAAGLPATAGGNLGTALSAQVAASSPETTHVVEVSSFQLETTDTFHPWIAVLLNLSPDHLDQHGSFEEYASAKARVFRNQTPDDWAVVNADDAAAMAIAASGRARRFAFALDAPVREGIGVEDGQIVRRRDGRAEPLLPVEAVRLPGRHLLADVLAATAVGALAGVPAAAMREAVESFTGLEHALERVAEVDGVAFVNDSKATNVVSVRRALESFDRDIVAIMGGRYKGGSFGDLRDVVRERAAAIVTIGEASDRIHEALAADVPVHAARSMAEAVRRAWTLAPSGGTVVLAPGCSSFDMFQDYAARGRAFKDEVTRLAAEVGAGDGERALWDDAPRRR
jgi:UDP-N-acetylmuramoylalanine--D-glutamate ligase